MQSQLAFAFISFRCYPSPVPDLPPRHLGRIVDPSVADDDDEPVSLDRLSDKPPAVVEKEPEPSNRPGVAILDEPSLRSNKFPPLPSSEVLLDPREAPPPIPSAKRPPVTPSVLSPPMTAVFAALFGLAGLFAIFALLHRFAPHPTPGSASASVSTVATAPPSPGVASVEPGPKAPPRALPNLEEEDSPATPGPWRVTDLQHDESVRIVAGTVGLDAFVNVLADKHVAKKETYRILAAFKTFDAFKKLHKSDKYTVAVDKASGKVKAFELEMSPFEVYQAREDESGLLVGTRLDMKLGERVRSTALRITGDNLANDLRAAHLRESAVSVIDGAFDGRASVASMPTAAMPTP